ncbi:hypothetical protein V9L05_17960 [Bernardetia sp. Wsw4-3y2]|uniref:hypothetical protein n=1 Tax=Bernardetia sp. Wsw4-3y2 TaxID=3127471 RepID=UPI0030CAE03B
MAETNLGQVVGIWLEPTEPPHKNVLWIKTINLLTSEKAGFIWNGIEWINIQGLGFAWKGEFDENTDYKKNDVVKFEDALYIKLSDVVSSGDDPDVSADFDLFLPTATPEGVEGSIQVKDANGKFSGSNLFTWIAQALNIVGAFFIKASSSAGRIFSVKNTSNTEILGVDANGTVYAEKMQSKTSANLGFGFSNEYLLLDGKVGIALRILGTNVVLVDSNTIYITKKIIVSNSIINRLESGLPLLLEGYADPEPTNSDDNTPLTNYVEIKDGRPKTDVGGKGKEGAGVHIYNWVKQTGTNPILKKMIEAKNGKLGFYGATPIPQQILSANPTNAELSDVLYNLGLVNRP